MVTTIATDRGDVKVAYQATETLTHVIFSTGDHSLAFTFTDEQGDALCEAMLRGRSLAAAPPDDAVARVLEAGGYLRSIAKYSGELESEIEFIEKRIAEWDAAVLALREQEGK